MHVKKKNSQFFSVIIPIILLVCIIAAVMLDSINTLKDTSTRITDTLNMQANNQAALLKDQIEGKYSLLRGYSGSFSEENISDRSYVVEMLESFMEDTDFVSIDFAYTDGSAVRNDGKTFDVSERWYFKECLAGNNAIEKVDSGKLVSEERIGIAVPVKFDGAIQGVLIGDMDESAFRDTLERVGTTISEYTYICNADGKVLVATEQGKDLMQRWKEDFGTDALHSVLTNAKFTKGDINQLKSDMQSGKSGQVRYSLDNDDRYAIYVPIEINDWYVVTVLPSDQVTSEVFNAIKSGYLVLLVVAAAVFVVIILILQREKNQEQQAKDEAAWLRDTLEHDSLTRLPQEFVFIREASKKIQAADNFSYCVVCFDIYKFKLLNEMFGWERGDEILIDIAAKIKEYAQKCSGLCTRISGDRFALLLPNSEEKIENLVQQANDKEIGWNLPIDIYLYFGVYTIWNKEIPVSTMIDCAQMVQKTIKGNFDNYFAVYDENLKKKMLREQEIEGSMMKAFENHEFVIYLQPQYHYETGEICGAEALVRWIHPEKGVIPPCDFIPIFETNGFITKVDEDVWEQSCAVLKSWLKGGTHAVPISVNISRADFFKGSIVEKMKLLVDKYEIPTDMLHLEITESAYMDNPNQMIKEITELREYGFNVEMDDFGSGYSSLNMLKDLPINVLKTDLKFLESEGIENRKDQIISHVVDMAHRIGLTVIAEGVEKKEQADYLASLGCEKMQGYYFSRPVPVEEFEKMLIQNE